MIGGREAVLRRGMADRDGDLDLVDLGEDVDPPDEVSLAIKSLLFSLKMRSDRK